MYFKMQLNNIWNFKIILKTSRQFKNLKIKNYIIINLVFHYFSLKTCYFKYLKTVLFYLIYKKLKKLL